MRFLKSQSTEILFNLIFLLSSITIVYLLDLDRHWTSMIDMDIMVVYNTLLLNSGIESQYFDQPSHTLLTINSYWYSILNFFGLINISDFKSLLISKNKIQDYQNLFFYSRILNILYIYLFSLTIFKILNLFKVSELLSFSIVLALISSKTFVNVAGILRTEILSALLFYASLYFLFLFIKKNIKKRIYLIFIGLFFLLSVFSKYLSIFLFIFFPLFFYFIYNDSDKLNYKNIQITKYENKFILNLLNVLSIVIFLFFYLRYTTGYVNYFFIPLLGFSFLITLILNKKFFNKNFNFSVIFFYFNVGLFIGFLLLLSKPFSTTNIGVVFNGFGFVNMYTYSISPYSNDFLSIFFLNLSDVFAKNFIFIKMYYLDYSLEGLLLILNIVGIIYFLFKKNFKYLIKSFLFFLIFVILTLIFSFRASPNYLIFVTPLLLINFIMILKGFNILKNTSKYFLTLVFMFIVCTNIIYIKPLNNNCNNYDCCKNLGEKTTFIRDWQRNFTKEFFEEVCFIKN